MPEEEILDDLNGHDFEELMVDVFRKMDYDDVEKSRKTGDEGRDIIMYDEDGKVVAECKHTNKVSRPVVQKLHSAVSTFEECDKGIVVTTGRFTNPAKDYAAKVNGNGGEKIELIDGNKLREIGERIGLDLYSGKIEVLCDETLQFPKSSEPVAKKVRKELEKVESFDKDYIDSIETGLEFLPVICAETRIDATFETSIGVISEVHEQGKVFLKAERGGPKLLDEEVAKLVDLNMDKTEYIDEEKVENEFSNVEVERFGKTETDYKDWIVDAERDHYAHTVTYTGQNNVTYNKDCRPNKSDVRILDITPVYLPRIDSDTRIKQYSYNYRLFTGGGSLLVDNNDLDNCVHCDREGKLTFCKNCGSINCSTHTKTERLEQEPICTGCAITERFFLKKKYFYTEENKNDFRRIYKEMPFYKKPLENKPLLATATAAAISATVWAAMNMPLF